MSATMTHPGLPDGMTPFALLELIEKLSPDLGLLDQDITYLRWLFRRTKRIDFNAGRICAVWMSVSKIAAELSFSPRKVHRIEDRLQRCGVVSKTSLANGRRYGRRGHDDQIVRAAGINLAPVIQRADDLLNKLRRSRLSQIDLKEEQDRARDLISDIRSLSSEEAIAAAKAVFPRLRPTEVRDATKLAEIIKALSAVFADFSDVDGRTEQAAPSDSLDRPSTKNEKIIKTCSASMPAQNRRLSTTPDQVRLLATDGFAEVIDMYADAWSGSRALSWQVVVMAAKERAHMIGISGEQWAVGCDLLGEVRTTFGMLLVDRNAMRQDGYRVENPAASFAGLVRKEAREQSVIDCLMAELRAHAIRNIAGEKERVLPSSNSTSLGFQKGEQHPLCLRNSTGSASRLSTSETEHA